MEDDGLASEVGEVTHTLSACKVRFWLAGRPGPPATTTLAWRLSPVA